MVHIPFLFFCHYWRPSSLLQNLQLYIPESITLLNYQCNVSLTKCSYYNSCSYRNNCGIQLHDGDLEQSHERKKMIFMFFFLFLYSAISDLDLGILKVLIRVCFQGVLQPAVYWFVPGMTWLSAGLYSNDSIYCKSLLFTSISYEQESFKLNEVNHG